ncbi:hypothetical protein FJY94_04615 [Candidatus Kaiserbacteria bacterium]|nr:hypothetical protein [Candidatus Kaiserbacteria bacterium]
MKLLIKACVHDDVVSDPGCALLAMDAETAQALGCAIETAERIFKNTDHPALNAVEFDAPTPGLMDFGNEDEDDVFHQGEGNFAFAEDDEFNSLRESMLDVELTTLVIDRGLDLRWRGQDGTLAVSTYRVHASQVRGAWSANTK